MNGAVDQVETKHGRLDLVHLNAGITAGWRPFHMVPLEEYQRVVDVNVHGTVFGVLASVPALARSGGGSIVVTASLAVARSYYALTKTAVVGFVRSAAPQLADHRVTINAICPGFIDTPLMAEELRSSGYSLLRPADVARATTKTRTLKTQACCGCIARGTLAVHMGGSGQRRGARCTTRYPEVTRVPRCLPRRGEARSGRSPATDAAVLSLTRLLADSENMEFGARRLVERMALVLQGSLLVRFSEPAVADAFCASRLDGDWGAVFGTLGSEADTKAILARVPAYDV